MYKERSLGKNGQPQNCGFHFNLYAINDKGEEILMTKDHVVAKSRGGANSVKNYVTSCRICNEEKRAMPLEKFLKKREELKNN